MFPLPFSSHRLTPLLTLVMVLVSGGSVLGQITGSATFRVENINGNDVITGAAVGVAIGDNDAFSDTFFDPNTGQISGIAIGSAGEITIEAQPIPDVGIGSITDSVGIEQQNIGRTEILLGPADNTDVTIDDFLR
ncbi:hypothetical protein IQ225_14010 [Synechocystis salina LEGE 06155]|nr:hypothetical protein [Synechocystis salina LEGE 06155]